MPRKLFAKRIEKIRASGIRKIFELVQDMKGAVDFSLGQADFDVPPEIKKYTSDVIYAGHNRYTVTQGIPQLHAKLREVLEKRYGRKIQGILITSGATGALFLTFMVLVEEGDEVLIPDPYFILYKHLVNVCGGVPVIIDTYPSFRLTREAITEKITKKTKILLFNNPVNPSGTAYTSKEVKMIADIAKEYNLILLSDEVYEHFSYDFSHEPTIRYHNDAMLISSFSKSYGMPGWRMGYVVGPNEIIDKMAVLQQFTFVCAPAPFQHALVKALDLDPATYIAPYKKKRDMIYEVCKTSRGILYISKSSMG
jgi:aspartate aminotransferase/aminotransferase